MIRVSNVVTACVVMAALGFPSVLAADGQQSAGNTDGFLAWNLGELGPGQSARRTVLFLHGQGRDRAAELLQQARHTFLPGWSDPWSDAQPATTPVSAADTADKDVWIKNAVTDFALAPDGSFFWEQGQVQSLKRQSSGKILGKEFTPPSRPVPGQMAGQLSRMSFYLQYGDSPAQHAGIRISGSPRLEELQVTGPTQALGPDRCSTVLETTDGQLRIAIRTALGVGPVVAQEYVVTNQRNTPVSDVRLSVYANLEADHSHENDHSVLDPQIGALVTTDPPSQVVCMMAGVELPDSGWSGVWPSQEALARGSGLARQAWRTVTDLPPLPDTYAAPGGEPVTVSLTPDETRHVLEADWLMQAEGAELVERTSEDIAAARQLAERFLADTTNSDRKRRLESDLAELDRLDVRLNDLRSQPDDTTAQQALYLDARQVKRRIVFSNPLIDFTQVLFIDQPYPHGREWQHQARHRNGMMATPGGRLLLLDGLSPAGMLRKIVDLPLGSYWRPDLSFDGKRVVFCYKAADDEAFHIYEAGLDGTGLRQLTDGPFDDLDPIYVPDGGIVFVSTRTQTYVRCMPYTYVYTLCRMDADGSNIRVLSHNNEPDWTPSLLDDGRIIYSRWEYTDKALWRIQSLWTVRPDGTQHAAFYGNQSVWPDHLGEARQIPGTHKVMFTGMAHHNYFAGTLGVIDPTVGANYPAGLTHITKEVAWPECGPGPNDDQITLDAYRHCGPVADYKSPYPLSDEWFLVSINTGPFNLYLMDVRGNKELIYRGQHNIWYGMPVRPRHRPSPLSSHVQWPGTDRSQQQSGILFSSDVYEGSGIPRGMAKYVRVLQSEYHTFTTWERDYRFEGPSISVVQAESVKRILGTAPVEEDGSFHIAVPSGKAIHFQLLDDQQRALQTMRSFTGVMPGEVRGCVGCHENQDRSPVQPGGQLALQRPPSKLTPPPWGDATVSFPRLVQPVLDRYCVSCHDGAPTSAAPNLKAVPDAGIPSPLHAGEIVFSEPYLYLIRGGLAGVIMAENYDQRDPTAYRTLPAMTALSYRSKLLELATSGAHHAVRVDETSRLQLVGWIDANGPYRGLDDVRSLDDPGCRDAPLVARP